ncbi:MAG: SPOR domain-containing protein [Flavobacterium sp.]
MKNKFILIFLFSTFFIFSQDISVEKDVKFDYIVQEKKKLINDNLTSDRIRIQIFNGTLDEAKKEIEIFKKTFNDLEGAIEFSHPTYKVLIGNFKTRLEAERNLLLIKKKYINAFIVKPRID